MPMANDKACVGHHAGCTGIAPSGTGYLCPNCRAIRTGEKSDDSAMRARFYGWTWRKFINMLKMQGNVICQRVVNGHRCETPTKIFHHLISPKVRPDLMYDYRNVIGLCQPCHPPDEGTPHWKAGDDYVPTVYRPPIF